MNKTIHELNALVSLANDDELIVYDVATGTSKKIKKSNLKNQLAGDLIVDTVQDGNLKAVTSNAVFNKLKAVKEDATSWFVENNFVEIEYAYHSQSGNLHTLDLYGRFKPNIPYITNQTIGTVPQPIRSGILEDSCFYTTTGECIRCFIDVVGNICLYAHQRASGNNWDGYFFGELVWMQ